jgi:hypothetical protein
MISGKHRWADAPFAGSLESRYVALRVLTARVRWLSLRATEEGHDHIGRGVGR